MPTKNRFAELQDEITAIRRDIHENPEILFETHRTAALVAEKLKEFGCDEIVTGIGRTGVVGVGVSIGPVSVGVDDITPAGWVFDDTDTVSRSDALDELHGAELHGALERKLRVYTRADLLVIDDFAVLEMDPSWAHLGNLRDHVMLARAPRRERGWCVRASPSGSLGTGEIGGRAMTCLRGMARQ